MSPNRLIAYVFVLTLLGIGFYLIFQSRKKQFSEYQSPSPELFAERTYTKPVVLSDKKLIAVEGILEKVEKRTTTFTTNPEQYFLLLRSVSDQNKTIEVGLGGEQRTLVLQALGKETESNAILQQTLTVTEILPRLTVGKKVTVEVDFTTQPEAVINEFTSKLKAFESGEASELKIFFLLLSKLSLETTI